VELAATNDYDLVLMDIFMPIMDGYQATKALRDAGFAKPIIAVTASAMKDERDKCIAAGMNDVLVKPFKKADLETMLAFWAGKQAEAAQLQASDSTRLAPIGYPPWDSSVFDFEGLVDTFLGQREKVMDLLGRFLVKTKGQLSDMEAALTAKDNKSLREISHSIKGAAWNLSARPLGDSAKTLEDAARDGHLELFETGLPELAGRFSEFEACVRYYQDKPAQAGYPGQS
jgi:YesN/AraC family two-component response regulator